jgi:GH18 family chitinase
MRKLSWPSRPVLIIAVALTILSPTIVLAQQSSVSTWDAAHFRIWGYIPYWATTSQISGFATNGLYTHVSDVLYFGGLRPDTNGNLTWAASSYQTQFNTIRSQSATSGFKMHLSMFEVTGGETDKTWESIIASPTKRATFVSQLKTIMLGGAGTADDVKGFNFDWERPNNVDTVTGLYSDEWGNYTQLARELRAAFKDPSTPTTNNWEVSVCDYGSTDSKWDDTSLFDAKVYDQLMIMGYHYGASSYATFASGKRALTGQGAAKAFSNSQLTVGVGTWGDGVDPDGTGPQTKPPTISLESIRTANPNLAYDALTYTGTVSGSTGTWNIESRKQVREKTQFAIDNGMPGMFTWTLHYDATNNVGLHRVMHHYAVLKRDVPDVNLDGKVDATDATTLANNMGTALTNTGITTAAQLDAFYLGGNWEKGDHEGNGFVNQADADWLAARYTALGVTVPDRLAYAGTFENFSNSTGIVGRWKAGRNAQNKLVETGNFMQNGSNYLTWSGTGVGAAKRSNYFATLRNQNSAETTAAVNSQSRTMQADLSANIDLSQNQDTYVTFLVRENTSPLSPAQLASSNRTLSLDFLDSTGATQFDFALHGLQQQFAIDSVADAMGQDVSASGFAANSTYLFVGKISGNGAGANTIYASLFASGAVVANFTDPNFQWMLSALGSATYNPVITDLQFTSRAEANYTVSNVWIGNAATILPPTLTSQGDFNHDGVVDAIDYVVWRKTLGQSGANLAADGNGNYQVDAGDLGTWRAYMGQTVAGVGSGAVDSATAVPEPCCRLLLVSAILIFVPYRSYARNR